MKDRCKIWSSFGTGRGRAILWVFSLALLIRLPLVWDPLETPDGLEFKQYASHLVQYGTLSWSLIAPAEPSAYRAPLYPLFLAGIEALFGERDLPVFLLQGILSALTCAGICMLGYELWEDERSSLLAGMGCACHPFLFRMVSSFMTEVLYTFLLVLSVWLFVRSCRNRNVTLCAASGVCMGLSCLTRPISQFMPFLMIAILCLLRLPGLNRKKWSVLVLISCFGVVLPWSLRNLLVMGRFILIAYGGSGLGPYLATTDPAVYHDVTQPSMHVAAERDPLVESYMRSFYARDESALMDIEARMRRMATERILEHPGRFAIQRLKVQPYLWIGSSYLFTLKAISQGVEGEMARSVMKGAAILFLHMIPIGLYGLGGLRALRRPGLSIFAASIPIYFAVLFFPFHIEHRYSIPAMPFLLLFAGQGLRHLLWPSKKDSEARRGMGWGRRNSFPEA